MYLQGKDCFNYSRLLRPRMVHCTAYDRQNKVEVVTECPLVTRTGSAQNRRLKTGSNVSDIKNACNMYSYFL